MRLQLKRIDHGDGTIDIVWQAGGNQYARTVEASEVNTRSKLGAYILSQMTIEEEDSQTYILQAHRDNGEWILDSFTADEDRDAGRDNIKGLPGWADWSAAEADAWVVANVTDLASAKAGLRAVVKMVIYLRDAVL